MSPLASSCASSNEELGRSTHNCSAPPLCAPLLAPPELKSSATPLHVTPSAALGVFGPGRPVRNLDWAVNIFNLNRSCREMLGGLAIVCASAQAHYLEYVLDMKFMVHV